MILSRTYPTERADRDHTMRARACCECGNGFEDTVDNEGGITTQPVIKWITPAPQTDLYLHPECAVNLINGLTRDVFEIEAMQEIRQKQSQVMNHFQVIRERHARMGARRKELAEAAE